MEISEPLSAPEPDPGVPETGLAAPPLSKASQHRAAKRALELIETVAESEGGLTLSDLAQRADVPKSTAHSLVHTLTAEGFLERGAESGRFSLGPRLLRLLGRLPHQFELPRVARPIMQKLVDEIGETTLLGVRRGANVLYVEQVEAPQFIRYVAPLGEPRPLHCTSIGKLFMGDMPEGDLRALLRDEPLPALTPYTKTDIEEIITEARAVKEQGYAFNRGESIAGVTAVSVAVRAGAEQDAPVLGGLSLVGPSERMAPKLQHGRDLLLDAAAQIALAIKSR
jgi:IclR family acetate operon transcriptional repressor